MSDVQSRGRTIQETANRIGIGVSTYWMHLKRGKDLPKITRIGRRVVIFDHHFDEWLQRTQAQQNAKK